MDEARSATETLGAAGAALAAWTVPDALARDAWILKPPRPDEIRSVMRDEAGLLLDRLLVRVARGRGALDVAVGEKLAALAMGDRLMQLGFSGLGDYARERLGIQGRTAQGMERLGRELSSRPVLRAAVLRGEVSARSAQTVLRVARGDDEATWTERARTETVRALEVAVRRAVAGPGDGDGGQTSGAGGEDRRIEGDVGAADPDDEPWERISFPLSPRGRAKLDEAMALAGKQLGAASPKWQRLEAICQEYLGSHPGDGGEDGDGVDHSPAPEWLEEVKEALERETQRWEFLGSAEPVGAPPGALATETDPLEMDTRLRELAAMRAGWDELLGHLAMLVRMLGLWKDMKFASFAHYCAERLAMSGRAVEQRISLERRLWELPALRQAVRAGRLGYEQARLVSSAADASTLDTWIRRAEGTTVIALRREVEAAEEGQTSARTEFALRVPRHVRLLLGCAFASVREVAERWLDAGECLERLADHFVTTYGSLLEERNTVRRRVLERDGGLCQVPGCSRAADDSHHVRFRSHGGGEEKENQTGTCKPHHLRGIHRGWIRVHGWAPDRLTWELPVRPGAPPRPVRPDAPPAEDT